MRPTVYTMPAALLLFLCLACNKGKNKNPDVVTEARPLSNSAATADSTAVVTDKEMLATYKEEEQTPSGQQVNRQSNKQPAPPPPPAAHPDWDKKIIKTADLNVEVK